MTLISHYVLGHKFSHRWSQHAVHVLMVFFSFTYPVLGDQVLDFENGGVPRHLGQIADKMCEWEGRIAEELGLIPADVAAINKKHPGKLNLQT